MAAFACFSSTKEKSIDAYKLLIQRFKEDAQADSRTQTHRATSANFSYYTAHKGKTTYVYKDFIYRLRKTECNMVCILLCDNPSPKLKNFIRLIEAVKIQDGHASCAYYGEIKNIVSSFMNYFTHIIDDVVKTIDKYNHLLDEDKMMSLINNTIDVAKENQEVFLKEFLPIETPTDQEKYAEIIEKHRVHLEQLRLYKENWSTHRHHKMEVFAKENFETSIKNTNELCDLTHKYMAMMLSDRLYEIAVSIGESAERMNTNKREYNAVCSQRLDTLIDNLYDKNKENMHISRRLTGGATDNAEVNRAIEVLKTKIEQYGNEETIARLQLETHFWTKTLEEFNEIADVLTNIRLELDKVEEQQKKFSTLRLYHHSLVKLISRTTELPGSKAECFETIGENIKNRKLYLEDQLEQMSRTLITFFSVRGTDRILYTDNIGSYFCDEFNHQNYITSFGQKFYHVNCYGDFLENFDAEPYYFDDYGRYILVNGEKVHQCAPCTSQYKLGDDGLFNKITKDCGHSERINELCRLEIKDLTDVEILPTRDILDIKGTLDAETVKYLWDSFGLILPEVLYDVGITQPKNPIHYLAHTLVKRRCDTTNAGLRYMKKEADKYRKKIYKERKEKAATESRAWRSKFVKRRKPEESDDSLDWAAYNQQVADWQFINSLGYYN